VLITSVSSRGSVWVDEALPSLCAVAAGPSCAPPVYVVNGRRSTFVMNR
jgi:hypothetical protein